jgi:ectoine hydroxylase-related dioxygenase (phytanoyl-CoA dioxygenase family)
MVWVSQVKRDGYGIIPAVISEPETQSVLDELSRIEVPRSRAGIRHVMNFSGISRIARAEKVLQIVKEILGEDAIPFRATLFDKSPTSNWLVMWHQDTALPLLEKKHAEGWGPWSLKDGVIYAHAPAAALEQVLAVRLNLDDSNLKNGPLRVLPGTHEGGVLTDQQIHELSEKVQSVDCPVARGGAVLMRPLVVHASSKSTNDQPRRVVHIEYAAHREILPGMTLAIA